MAALIFPDCSAHSIIRPAFPIWRRDGQGPNDAFRDRTLSGNFGWRFSDSDRVSLALRDNDSNAGTPGQTLLEPANLTDNIGLHNFSAKPPRGIHHGLALASSGERPRSFIFANSISIRRFPACTNTTGPVLRASRRISSRGLRLTAGYEYEVENGFINFIGMHERRNNQAGFLDANWQPIARLTLDAGARAEDNANFGTRVVPRVGAAYALRIAQGAFGDTRLHASYGQGIVEPRFDQSFGSDPCFPGNPGLSPEQSRTIYAGFEQKLASDRVTRHRRLF